MAFLQIGRIQRIVDYQSDHRFIRFSSTLKNCNREKLGGHLDLVFSNKNINFLSNFFIVIIIAIVKWVFICIHTTVSTNYYDFWFGRNTCVQSPTVKMRGKRLVTPTTTSKTLWTRLVYFVLNFTPNNSVCRVKRILVLMGVMVLI